MSDASLAARAGVPTPVIAAIRKVESGGNPSAIRFETRLFRERTGQTIEGSGSSAFQEAFSRDPRAAVESTSFGLYQVLGGALLRLYGPSPATALARFRADPRKVSDELLVAWFQSRPAAREAANSGDWAALARAYNGSDQTPWLGRFRSALENTNTGISPALGLAIGAGVVLVAGGIFIATVRLR